MPPPYNYLEFYQKYNLSYWANKIALLHNTLKNFEKVKGILNEEIDNPNDDEYLLMLRIEIHFMYYQISEALFEFIFALEKYDERNLWKHISISKFENYPKIKAISEGDKSLFNKTIKLTKKNDRNKIMEISFLQYVFFHYTDFNKIEYDLDNNLDVIKKLLSIIAFDFSNREEYNAYKHSLRFIVDKPYLGFQPIGTDKKFEFEAEEGFGFLVKKEIRKEIIIEEVLKSFTTDKDLKMCKYSSWLINNIISSRRAYYFKTKETLISFHEINIDEIFKEVNELSEVRFRKENYNKKTV
jgi:hypothetical protein